LLNYFIMGKKSYRNKQELIHIATGEKIVFLKWLDEETANCLDKKNMGFIRLSRAELDKEYTTASAIEKTARTKRAGQMWK